jgi:hypothetical protein
MSLQFPQLDALIQQFEGYGSPGAATITGANNPGALADTPFTRAHGSTGRTSNGFATFPDFATGQSAQDALVAQKVQQGATPRTLIGGGDGVTGWSPATAPGNTPASTAAYSDYIAKALGIGVDTALNPLIGSVPGSGPGSAVASATSSAATGAAWFAALSLPQIVSIILGIVLIGFGIFFLRPVQQVTTQVVTQSRRAIAAIGSIAP